MLRNTCGGINLRGMQGVPGATGATGATGTTGAQGATGATGPRGAQGIPGAQGEPGLQGPTGAQGAQGTQGEPGLQGPTGAQGMQGPAGEIGTIEGAFDSYEDLIAAVPTGHPGDAYYVNPDMYIWDEAHGRWVNIGRIAGPQGVTGPQGAQGIPGMQGLRGEQGVPGATGAQGIPGVPGPQGLPGVQGASGPKGATGSPGATGPAGGRGTGGFVIPFSSGDSSYYASVNSSGDISQVVSVGFGHGSSSQLAIHSMQYALNTSNAWYHFILPVDCTLRSIYFTVANSVIEIPSYSARPFVLLATAPLGGEIFTLQASTRADGREVFAQGVTYSARNKIIGGSRSDLDVPLSAGTEVAIVAGFMADGLQSMEIIVNGGLYFEIDNSRGVPAT
jgi:hypothetical protein